MIFRLFYAALNWTPKDWNRMAKHCPDNPREWDPNHLTLSSPLAPHETSGLLRMHRAGHSGEQIMKTLKVRAADFTRQFSKALDAEQAAHDQGRPIYDAKIKSRPRA
ncbi:hypothetical protein SEA_STEAMY_66 [Mycobacterium phage Steamy]|uniref:Gp68-like predicted RNA polymerase component domain-containing protein n=1 Tax=Mycobacterium phage Steamy TaxID=2250309 RepID=A0A345L0N8_9CAUD|nr:hypothetical protein KIV62_gp35 [Mycobacterium phage Steamy]AXH48840.1 hypothetical protein SEA_STEAMY_66 [Mycobacterium phage Steamy]